MDNFQKLPNVINYKILAELPLKNLQTMCLTNKKYANICKSDKFWMQKILLDFPELKNIPEKITAKEWYFQILYSGDLYIDFKNPLREFILLQTLKNAYQLRKMHFFILTYLMIYIFIKIKILDSILGFIMN